jgi:hypothetical protein
MHLMDSPLYSFLVGCTQCIGGGILMIAKLKMNSTTNEESLSWLGDTHDSYISIPGAVPITTDHHPVVRGVTIDQRRISTRVPLHRLS